MPPIECWWKTDRSAVRVGETFLLTLTCAVLDTERVKVVVDESSLDAVGAASDAVRDRRRPAVPRHPRMRRGSSSSTNTPCACSARSSSARKSRCRGCRLPIACRTRCREARRCRAARRSIRSCRCPSACCRSCLPARPTSATRRPTRSATSRRASSARTSCSFVAGVAFVLAGLMAVMLVARAAVKRRRRRRRAQRTVSPVAVLGAASRELGAVQAASQRDGWSSDLAGRAAAALRLAGAVALSRPVSQKEVDRNAAERRTGRRALRVSALLRGKRRAVGRRDAGLQRR